MAINTLAVLSHGIGFGGRARGYNGWISASLLVVELDGSVVVADASAATVALTDALMAAVAVNDNAAATATLTDAAPSVVLSDAPSGETVTLSDAPAATATLEDA